MNCLQRRPVPELPYGVCACARARVCERQDHTLYHLGNVTPELFAITTSGFLP